MHLVRAWDSSKIIFLNLKNNIYFKCYKDLNWWPIIAVEKHRQIAMLVFLGGWITWFKGLLSAIH